MAIGKAKAIARHRRAPPEERRQDLIDAAARALAGRGAGGVSARAIAAEAGVSPGLLIHHFDGVDALLVATYRDVSARVAAALDAATEAAGSEPRARLSAYVAGSFAAPVMDPELLASWLGLWSLTRSIPAMAEAHAENYAAYRGAVERLLAECGAPGDARLDAVAITALIDGLWLELCLDDAVFSAEEARGIAERWLDALLMPRGTSAGKSRGRQ